jgi:WD40 repeat protein
MESQSEKISLSKIYFTHLEDNGIVCKYDRKRYSLLFVGDASGHLYTIDHYKNDLSEIHQSQISQSIDPVAKTKIHDSMIYDFETNRHATQLFIATSGFRCFLFDIETQTALNEFLGHSNSVKNVDICKSNEHLGLSGGKDGKVLLWDFRETPSKTKPSCTTILNVENERITGCAFLNDEKMIVTSRSNSFDCDVFDLRKIMKFNSRKKKFIAEADKCHLYSINRNVHIEYQLRDIHSRISKLDKQNGKLGQSLRNEYLKLQAQHPDFFSGATSNQNMVKGLTCLRVYSDQQKLLTSAINNRINSFDLSSLMFEPPVELMGHHISNPSSK